MTFRSHDIFKFIRIKKCYDFEKPHDVKQVDSMVFRGELLAFSDEEKEGLLEKFKKFCLMLGYSPNMLERVVLLRPNEEVVEIEEKDYSSSTENS